MGLTTPVDQYHRSTILQPDSFEEVIDSEGSRTVENSVTPCAKVTKIRPKQVTRQARLRKVATCTVDQSLIERLTSEQLESTDFLHVSAACSYIKQPPFTASYKTSRLRSY